jgi:sugar lactone lactonase YvrE
VQALSVGVIYPKDSAALLAGPYEVRPNDLVVSSKDAIYFTLPGNNPPAVFYIPAGGKAVFAAIERRLGSEQFTCSNSVLFSPRHATDLHEMGFQTR